MLMAIDVVEQKNEETQQKKILRKRLASWHFAFI